MNSVVVAILVIAVVVAAIVVSWMKQRKRQLGEPKSERPELKPSTADKKKPSEHKPEEEKSETGPKTAAEKIVSDGAETEGTPRQSDEEGLDEVSGLDEVTEKEPPPGVRLDEEAEDKAVAELERDRRERKLKRLRQGLAPTRGGLISKLGAVFKGKKELNPQILERLEEVLLTSDVGTKTAQKLLGTVQSALEKDELSDMDAAWELLREAVREILTVPAEPWQTEKSKPFVVMVVGVNGVGKTTTIGKLATKFTEQNKKVVLAAADTFRAAAVNQLTIWGRRADADVVKSKEGADPSSVVFEAIKKAKEIDADIVIADTAGRLHTQQPLMEELKKIHRVMDKAHETAPHEVLLVLDATTGQNAIQQVAMFKETLKITGLALTKLDGTAKGGVIIGICHEHKIPVRFIGIGEAKEDLREFDVDDFVDALFYRDAE